MEQRRTGGMMVRLCAMALAAAALAGCASSGYPGYDYYPDETYYDGPYDPYHGGGFGYGSYYDDDYDDDYDRYFHPSRNVSCDRVRDICYDRYGPSYEATARHLGEREANRAYKKYGDNVFLFSPRPGVSCDRRSQECSDGQWTDRAAPDRMKRLERRNVGAVGSGSGFEDGDAPIRRVAPARRTKDEVPLDPLGRLEPGNIGSVGSDPGFDDDAPVRRVAPAQRGDDEAAPTRRNKPRLDASPPPIADNDNDVVRPSRRAQSEQPDAPPRLKSNDKVRDGGAGNACPPRGCTD
jgi:hypothetical protein